MSGFKIYNESFKQQVVAEVLNGQTSKAEARRRYHIVGHCTVLKWIRKFEAQSLQITSMKSDSHTSKEDLFKRIKELKRQVEDEKLHSEALALMIDIVEKQLDIEIRKKPGTKQSKRQNTAILLPVWTGYAECLGKADKPMINIYRQGEDDKSELHGGSTGWFGSVETSAYGNPKDLSPD